MKDRIRKIIDSEEMSQSEFAEKVGVQRSNISHILSGRNNPSVDFIQKLLNNFTNINAEWVVLGTGNMYKDSNDTLETIDESPKQQNNNTNNQQKIDYSVTNKEQPIKIKQNSDETKINNQNEESKSEPEQILVLYKDQTFITYKKR